MKIISYRRKYLDQVLDLNKQLVKHWYKLEGDQAKRSVWEKLTPKERYLHGGPWNDPTTLKIHLKSMQKIGYVELLIDNSDNLLGMIEYHHFDDIIHIDWMMTSPNYRKKGLGSRLIEKSKDTAKKLKVNSIWTEPEDGVEHFYYKNNFKIIQPDYFRYSIKNMSNVTKKRNDYDEFRPREISTIKISGEANNTKKYLSLLLETNVEYADIFNDNYPLVKYEETDFTIFFRNISGMKNKYSVFHSSLTDKPLKELEMYLPRKCISYYTSIGDLNTEWELTTTMQRLRINLQ